MITYTTKTLITYFKNEMQKSTTNDSIDEYMKKKVSKDAWDIIKNIYFEDMKSYIFIFEIHFKSDISFYISLNYYEKYNLNYCLFDWLVCEKKYNPIFLKEYIRLNDIHVLFDFEGIEIDHYYYENIYGEIITYDDDDYVEIRVNNAKNVIFKMKNVLLKPNIKILFTKKGEPVRRSPLFIENEKDLISDYKDEFDLKIKNVSINDYMKKKVSKDAWNIIKDLYFNTLWKEKHLAIIKSINTKCRCYLCNSIKNSKYNPYDNLYHFDRDCIHYILDLFR